MRSAWLDPVSAQHWRLPSSVTTRNRLGAVMGAPVKLVPAHGNSSEPLKTWPVGVGACSGVARAGSTRTVLSASWKSGVVPVSPT